MAIVFALCLCSSITYGQSELKESMISGEKLYATNCQSCHMANGQGVANVFPPLAKSDYLMKDKTRSIKQVLYGAQGEMVVNGITYNGQMQAYDMLSNKEIADVLNYIRNTWGNEGEIVKPQEVSKVRE